MLVVFPPSFVADTKIIFGYNFVAPLKENMFFDYNDVIFNAQLSLLK